MSTKRLTRPTDDRVFLGVCSGLAEYFGVDPTIVRLLFVLAIFAGGASPLAYIVLALVMPTTGSLTTGTAAAPSATAAEAKPSALGDEVVRTVEGAIAKATDDGEKDDAAF